MINNELLLNSVRSLRADAQLKEVLSAFKNAGIRILVLKGAALARWIYPNPAERSFCDLDLLVLPENVIKARAVLESIGYKCLSRMFEVFHDFQVEEKFNHANKHKIQIELHWGLHFFFGIKQQVGVKDLFERAIEIKTPEFTFETLCPVDTLIHLSLHLMFKHNQSLDSKWVRDIALLVPYLTAPQDWKDLQARSVEWRARLAVEQTLKMAQSQFGVKLPDEFSDFSAWPAPAKTETRAWHDAFRQHKDPISKLRVRGIFRNPSLIWRFLFPPREFMQVEFPSQSSWQLPASYARRWIKWLNRAILIALWPKNSRARKFPDPKPAPKNPTSIN